MEGENKKRKRIDPHRHHHHHPPPQAPANGGLDPRRKGDEEMASPAPPQPSEEEVEEFFTILRQMNVALKYFGKGGSDVGSNSDGRKRTTALALEATEAADGVKIGGDNTTTNAVVVENGGKGLELDLNVVPEAET